MINSIVSALAQQGRLEFLGSVKITATLASWSLASGWNAATSFATIVRNGSSSVTITDRATSADFTAPEVMDVSSATFFARTFPTVSSGSITVLMYKMVP